MARVLEGRKEGRNGAIDGCQTAFQASYPYREAKRSVSPRKDIIPLGRGRVGRSTMVDGHRDRAKAGGEEEEGECKKVVARTRAFAAFYKLFN